MSAVTDPAIPVDWPQLWAQLQQGLHDGLHLGGQVFVARNGVTIADFAFGEDQPGVNLSPEHWLPWLSSTKPLAALLTAQLWEQEQLDWDDRVASYIPEFATGGKEAITLRHLLTHTGGIRGVGRRFTPETPWAEIIAEICASPLEPNWIPGQTAGYHVAASWFILGEVLQRITGQSYSTLVRERLLEPLGLTHAWCGMPADVYQANQHLIGRMWLTEKGQRELLPWHEQSWCTWCSPGGGGRGPIRELGQFYVALLQTWHGQDRGLCRPETLRMMVQRHRENQRDLTFQHKIDWGLGLIINSARYGAQTVPYGYGLHASEETFGHSGFQSSCGFADPHYGLVVALVVNGTPGEARNNKRFRLLNSAIYEDLGLAR